MEIDRIEEATSLEKDSIVLKVPGMAIRYIALIIIISPLSLSGII